MTQRRMCKSKFLRPRGPDDVSIVKTAFVPVLRVSAGNVEHSLWVGQLSNGRDQFVVSIGAKPNVPRYTKAFPERELAESYFRERVT